VCEVQVRLENMSVFKNKKEGSFKEEQSCWVDRPQYFRVCGHKKEPPEDFESCVKGKVVR
jgi:hypothetical protein